MFLFHKRSEGEIVQFGISWEHLNDEWVLKKVGPIFGITIFFPYWITKRHHYTTFERPDTRIYGRRLKCFGIRIRYYSWLKEFKLFTSKQNKNLKPLGTQYIGW